MSANAEEEEGTSPLLSKEERHYHPGCPGCDHDRTKELQTGLPYKEFAYVWMICLTTGTPAFLCPSHSNLIFQARFFFFWKQE